MIIVFYSVNKSLYSIVVVLKNHFLFSSKIEQKKASFLYLFALYSLYTHYLRLVLKAKRSKNYVDK